MGRARFEGEALKWLTARSPHYVALGNIPKRAWLTKTADEFLEKFQYPLTNDTTSVADYRDKVSSPTSCDCY